MGRISTFERDFIEDGTITATEGLLKQATNVWRRKRVSQSYNEVWRYKPPTSREFFDKYVGEPLYPLQQEFCDAMFGLDPFKFRDSPHSMGMAYWGKGGGKDRTVVKLYIYAACLLSCMVDPQGFLDLGAEGPIDLCNVSINADQAKDVFFENFKSLIRRTVDPETGDNWFATKNWWIGVDGSVHYMDLRDKKDIQTTTVDFGRGVKAHSLNSERYTGEGLTLLFAAFDEIGAFKPHKALGSPAEGVKGLLKSLTETVTSRSPKYGAVFVFSYKYYDDCPMSVLVEKEKIRMQKVGEGEETGTFISEAATWEVNLKRSRREFDRLYDEDPDTAMMTYECKSSGKAKRGRLIGHPEIISRNINEERISPVIGGNIQTDSPDNIDFYSWFVGEKGIRYHLHIDLAKGKVLEGGDAVGLCLAHPKEMKVKLSDVAIEARKESGSEDASYEGASRRGMFVDLLLQVVASSGKEVSLQGIRRLIFSLIDRGFNIVSVTFDGWQSVDMIQELTRKGIEAKVFSVDRTTAPYDTLKSLEYQGLVHRYSHPIYEREIIEIHRDKAGKWDHPTHSSLRERLEGLRHGSKDVSDSVAACAAFISQMKVRKPGEEGLYVGVGGRTPKEESSEEKQERLRRKDKELRERFFRDEEERD